jgi:hypothetical protein
MDLSKTKDLDELRGMLQEWVESSTHIQGLVRELVEREKKIISMDKKLRELYSKTTIKDLLKFLKERKVLSEMNDSYSVKVFLKIPGYEEVEYLKITYPPEEDPIFETRFVSHRNGKFGRKIIEIPDLVCKETKDIHEMVDNAEELFKNFPPCYCDD